MQLDVKRHELNAVSVAKTMMMLTVVLYHSCCIWSNFGWGGVTPLVDSAFIRMIATWMNTFHIHTFAFASGYLFYMIRYEKGGYRTTGKDIRQRAKRLLLPYAFACLWVIPARCVTSTNIAMDIVRDYVLAESPSQLWFLVMIFGLFIFFYFTSDWVVKQKPLYMLLGFMLVYYVRIPLGKFLPVSVFQISNVMRFAVFYFCGILFRKNNYTNVLMKKGMPLYLGTINILLFAVYYLTSMQNQMICKLVSLCMLPIVSMSGIALVMALVLRVDCEKILDNWKFQRLSEYSVGIYMIHQQIIYVTIRLFNYSWMPPAVFVVLNFAIAISVSYGLVHLLQKVKPLRVALGMRNA